MNAVLVAQFVGPKTNDVDTGTGFEGTSREQYRPVERLSPWTGELPVGNRNASARQNASCLIFPAKNEYSNFLELPSGTRSTGAK